MEPPVVHIGQNSPEYIAYCMMNDILRTIERKDFSAITREEYLRTYAECLSVVRSAKYSS